MIASLINSIMKRSACITCIILLLSCLCLSIGCIAQSAEGTVNAALSNSRILMGEQVKLNVQVTLPVGKPVTQWYNLPDTFNHIEIIDRSPVDSSLEGSAKTYRQSFTITAFDSGIWVIPELVITVDHKTINSDALELTVVPAQLKDSSYHDIREIIDVPAEKTPWWYWVAAVLSVVAIGVLAWLWWKSRKAKPVTVTERKDALSPMDEALQKLRALRAEGLPEKGEWKKYYSVLTDVFKGYAGRKFQEGALQKTTDELLLQLSPRLSKESLGEAAETLRIADAVKFARYQPDMEQSSYSITRIERIIKELDSLKQ